MLLDTSGLMCLFDKSDIRHIAAKSHFESANRRLTHNYIFAEFVALVIARRAPLASALLFIEAIHRANEVEVRWIDAVRHQQAMKLLSKRQDKRWTLCDGVSFLLMTDSKISDALPLTIISDRQALRAC
jgi:predicted nucleic acid-binding protein